MFIKRNSFTMHLVRHTDVVYSLKEKIRVVVTDMSSDLVTGLMTYNVDLYTSTPGILHENIYYVCGHSGLSVSIPSFDWSSKASLVDGVIMLFWFACITF